MTSLRSQRTRCPPFSGSKSPSGEIEHQPHERLAQSLCGRETILGPKLIVIEVNAVPS